jgi:hypothetical protein
MGQPLRSFAELPEPNDRPEWHLLAVLLVGASGERWHAIGLGETVDDALTWARQSAPTETRWLVADWSDLFGD